MSLKAGLSLDKFRDAERRPGAKCVLSEQLLPLAAADRAALEEALADHSITAAAISRVLGDAGFQTSAQSVARHRRGDCRCERTS